MAGYLPSSLRALRGSAARLVTSPKEIFSILLTEGIGGGKGASFIPMGLLDDRLGMKGFISAARLFRWVTGEGGTGKNVEEEGFAAKLFTPGE